MGPIALAATTSATSNRPSRWVPATGCRRGARPSRRGPRSNPVDAAMSRMTSCRWPPNRTRVINKVIITTRTRHRHKVLIETVETMTTPTI